MSKKIKESIVFYRSFYDSIRLFPQDARLPLYEAITAYGFDQVEPDFTGVEHKNFIEAVWSGIRPQLRANYQRWLNGNGGGCPKGTKKPSMIGNQNARKQNQNKTETKPNIKEKEKEKGNMNVRGTGDKSLTLPFSDKEFIDTWNELRKQPKWKRKTVTALQKSLDRLAGYDVRFAIELMNTSIENGYQGVVYNGTPSRYEQWQKSHPHPVAMADNDKEMARNVYSAYDYD